MGVEETPGNSLLFPCPCRGFGGGSGWASCSQPDRSQVCLVLGLPCLLGVQSGLAWGRRVNPSSWRDGGAGSCAFWQS